jgi:hypothetical protein
MSDKPLGPDSGDRWTDDDVEEFMQNMEDFNPKERFGDSGNDPNVTVHPGAVLAGIVLTVFALYGAYIQQIEFTAFTLGLLTVLALGSKYINE